MRNTFFKRLPEEMRKDRSLFFLMGDTGFNLVEPIFQEFPDRSMNVGIAEQNLIGIAAGLSNQGFRPVCYAISNFLVQRCLEQIRNDICLHKYRAILVGTSTGLDNGALWATHYVVDDVGCLKPLPNISIYSPSSLEGMNAAFDEILGLEHAAYIRFGKSNFSDGSDGTKVNRFVLKNDAAKVLVIAHGRMIMNALEAEKLSPGSCSIFAMDRIKPFDDELLRSLVSTYSHIAVVENNFKSGLYNSLCQWVVEQDMRPASFISISPVEEYKKEAGDIAYLEGLYGLTPKHIADKVRALAQSS